MNKSGLEDYRFIFSKLVEPSNDPTKRRELTSQILRHKNYPKWLEEKLAILDRVPKVESVLSEIRNNPTRIDDFTSILKIGAFFVSNGYSSLEFIPSSRDEPRPDIKFSCASEDVFVEVKRLQDTAQWGPIQDSLRAIPSGISVEIEVDFDLYRQQVDKIIDEVSKALRCRAGAIPSKIDLGYATIVFRGLPGIPSTSTAVMITTLDAWSIVGDKDYKGERGQIRYSDIRRIFESRLTDAVRQLSSVEGCRIVAFDLQRVFGDPNLLMDAFIGTLKCRFLMPAGAEWYRVQDGLFHNSAYSSVDGVVTFIGDEPHEALANPQAGNGERCVSIAGLDKFPPSE
jgi:hypothetical protein